MPYYQLKMRLRSKVIQIRYSMLVTEFYDNLIWIVVYPLQSLAAVDSLLVTMVTASPLSTSVMATMTVETTQMKRLVLMVSEWSLKFATSAFSLYNDITNKSWKLLLEISYHRYASRMFNVFCWMRSIVCAHNYPDLKSENWGSLQMKSDSKTLVSVSACWII